VNQKQLSPLLLNRLCQGACVCADTVTTPSSMEYLGASTPNIPVADYHAGVIVVPLMESYRWTANPIVRDEEPRRGFKVIYREIAEDKLQYGYDYDRLSRYQEVIVVASVEELEQVLLKYLSNLRVLRVDSCLL
jgi:hypothetical protein